MRRFNFQKKNWKFIKEYLEDVRGNVLNPGRGWYQIYSFRADEYPDFDELTTSMKEEERLVLVIINIASYKNRNLDQTALLNINQIISFFVYEKKDIILRLVYDNNGKGLEHEPLTLARIEGHIKELEEIFRKYGKHLYIVQGFLIGSWGEMHTSKFLAESCLKKLYKTLLSVTDEHTFLAVRRPVFWRRIEKKDQDFRLGLFNDGMLATESHLGTFGVKSRAKAEWKEAWCPEDELNYINQLCKKVPHGGEAVLGEMSDQLSPSETIDLLKKMHVSYLNTKHDKRLLTKWKNQTWEDGTLYEYIGTHLGYRFSIKDVDVTFPKARNIACIHVQIENTGFSNCYEEGITKIIVKTSDGKSLSRDTKWDIRTWEAGELTNVKVEIPLMEGELYIKTMRKKDGTLIRYATNGKKEVQYLGKILKSDEGTKE